jgi:hypothetical protein
MCGSAKWLGQSQQRLLSQAQHWPGPHTQQHDSSGTCSTTARPSPSKMNRSHTVPYGHGQRLTLTLSLSVFVLCVDGSPSCAGQASARPSHGSDCRAWLCICQSHTRGTATTNTHTQCRTARPVRSLPEKVLYGSHGPSIGIGSVSRMMVDKRFLSRS